MFSNDLLTTLFTKPYAGIVSYMAPHDCLTVQDFDRSSLATHHWLDEPRNMDGRKSKKRDSNTVFKVFARLDDYGEEDHRQVRQNMLSTITTEFNWYNDVAFVCLQMHKTTLSKWIDKMQDPRYPADELAVYALSRIYNQHSVIYTKTKTWSSLGTTRPLSEKELYDTCKIRFVNLGKGKLVELVPKPSSLMPVVNPTPLLSTYDSGYYETGQVNVPEIKEEPTDDYMYSNSQSVDKQTTDTEHVAESIAITPGPDHDGVKRVEPAHDHTTRCPVHGCDTTTNVPDEVRDTGRNSTMIQLDPAPTIPLLFPSSLEVCDTGANSALNNFNPLVESEPNLVLGDRETESNVTDQNSFDVTLSSSDMISDAKTKKWSVPVRKLSLEEVEFLSGPRLLPNLAAPNMVIPPAPLIVPDPEPYSTVRPTRVVKKPVNYADQCIDDNDEEEYLPPDESDPTDKNNINTASHESEDTDDLPLSVIRKREEENTLLSELKKDGSPVNSDKTGRRFKCKFCTVVRYSQKDLNNHHKQTHGKLNCPDCDEVYDTPSGLHRHSYRHKKLKFKCSKCGDKFPFQSQLDDHLIKHSDKRVHKCNTCTKKFKNASSLRKHAMVHDGQKHACKHKKCDYWSFDKRNLEAHNYSKHSKEDRYGCEKCGKTFKHHTQMARHCDSKKCS